MSALPRITPGRKRRFREKLSTWYVENARTLPWRQTRDPYKVLVSEMMLQQTQVSRALPKYEEWFRLFPTVDALAKASQRSVVAAWQGLGYNRRALFLHRSAQVIVEDHRGVWPKTAQELLVLPGVGPYTAAAVASFAFGEEAAILDTNVKRVLGRIFAGFKALPSLSDERLWELSRAALPKGRLVYDYNQALMDFGAQVCTSRAPSCEDCPMRRMCQSFPAISTAAPEELRFRRKVSEPLYYGQPRRIWRGKILKEIHRYEDGSATLQAIGRAIQDDFEASRLPWLQSVVDTLKKDGLVHQRGSHIVLK